MSVRKRALPSGEIRWQVDYRDQKGARRSRQFTTKKAATDYQITAGGEIKAGIHVPDSASVTVEQAGRLWLQRSRTNGLEASTIRQYSQHLDLHISPLIGAIRLSRMTRPAVAEFRDRLLESRSRQMVRKVLTSLTGIMAEAQERGLVGTNSAARTKLVTLKRHDKEARIPSKDEIRALINKAGELWPSTCGWPWRPFIITALFTGLRASEIRGLAWDHIDFDSKLVRVGQRADFWNKMGSPKSKAGTREIPLAPMCINALKQWRLACPKSAQNLVFPTRTGTVISNTNMHRQCWRPLLRATGLIDVETDAAGKTVEVPRFRFHELRHAAASLFIEQGWSAKKVMAVMGHSSINLTFSTYGHLWRDVEDDANAMAQIEKRLFS
jgi:integrase